MSEIREEGEASMHSHSASIYIPESKVIFSKSIVGASLLVLHELSKHDNVSQQIDLHI